MSNNPETLQFRRGFRFLFIFRIAPGFFVGIIPRRHIGFTSDFGTGDEEMTIMRISEQEFMFLRRIGMPESHVMMAQQYEDF